jgi:inorganic triphosphatase YgiF
VDDAIETELKLRLPDDAARQRLLALLLRPGIALPEPSLQENHFFDTEDDALRRNECALRLRAEDGRWELALKGPALSTGDAALHVRGEEQRTLDARAAAAVLDGSRSPLDLLLETRPQASLVRRVRELVGREPLVPKGSFRNERLRLGPEQLARAWELCLELDRTTFPGGTIDQELEVELRESRQAPAVLAALRALLREAKIEWAPASSKVARLFRILDGDRGGSREPFCV